MWDLSSLTGDRTSALCIGRLILNQWTAREVPGIFLAWQVELVGCKNGTAPMRVILPWSGAIFIKKIFFLAAVTETQIILMA